MTLSRWVLVATLAAALGCTKEKAATPVTTPPPAPAAQPAAQAAPAQPAPTPGAKGAWMEKAAAGHDIYATLKTNQGDIVVRLFPKDAPKTVENFVGLAAGEKEWTHPKTGERSNKPLYDGTVFHRVIAGFMIQGGDPLGMGVGGPGYKFEDELQSGRKFDKPGLLAMANAGPNTNGSQFFITVAPTAWLNGRHTIFGEVVRGYDVVEKISKVQTDRDRPTTDVVLIKVELNDQLKT